MRFEHRSYSGNLVRPTPEIYLDDDATFGAIVTPWGPRQSAKKVMDTVRDFVMSARQDGEVTSPFQHLSCLSGMANTLRAAVMLANDLVYREENKSEHISGVELLVFSRIEKELSFAHVGQPNLYLARPQRPWVTVSSQLDLPGEFSQQATTLSPLPHNLIGLHSTTNMNVASIQLQPSDRLVLLSRSVGPEFLLNVSFEQSDVAKISQHLSVHEPNLPFWVGVLEV